MSNYEEARYEEGDKGLPFFEEIMATVLPPRFKEPTDIEGYDDRMDPQDHFNAFNSHLYQSGAMDTIKCKASLITLKKLALKWFNTLPPRSIVRFAYVSSRFLAYFTMSKVSGSG